MLEDVVQGRFSIICLFKGPPHTERGKCTHSLCTCCDGAKATNSATLYGILGFNKDMSMGKNIQFINNSSLNNIL